MTYGEIARICHEANRAYCITLGDTSQVSWDEAPMWQVESAVDGVMHRFRNPLSTPEDSHINWTKMKESEGWVYGPVKDVAKKEHPCLVPYDDLPVEQRKKDELFTAIISVFI